jgi:DNA ligase-1
VEKVTLYGLDKNSGYKIWQVYVEGGSYFVVHGKLDGKLQTKETVCTPKNIGKANETTPEQQAELEAVAKVQKQLDKGYRFTKEELEDLPLMPILAYPFEDKQHVMSDEVYCSPKLNGVRCLVFVDNGNVRLMSRGGKDYTVPQISEEFKRICPEGKFWFDGEIYYHGELLQDIVSAVKRVDAEEVWLKTQDPEDRAIMKLRRRLKFYLFEKIEFNEDGDFKKYGEVLSSYYKIRMFMDSEIINDWEAYINCAELIGKNEIEERSKLYHRQGFEGAMVRHKDFIYESGKRSSAILKHKPFQDAEFQVVDILEDMNGNAKLVMKNNINDETFETSFGSFTHRKHQLENKHLYIGKWLTVQFQDRSKKDIPLFPTGQAWREVDDNGEVLE